MKIFDAIGNTPVYEIEEKGNHLYLKFEGANPFGSSKDRSAHYVLDKLYREKKITKDTVIIESSSGNMGIALAAKCHDLGNRFICVIDPHISSTNEMLIQKYGAETIKVTEKDENNSYLKTRLKTISNLEKELPDVYWFNQYGNPLVCEAYESIGKEMLEQVKNIDYVFVAVSSAGTIAGISKSIKEVAPNIIVVGVDVQGSKVFEEDTTKKRYLSGIGSSIQSDNLKRADMDYVILVDEKEGIEGCRELLENHLIFGGGSSGCVYAAIKDFIKENHLENKNIIGLLNDRGDRYIKTVYCDEWVENNFGKTKENNYVIRKYEGRRKNK